jgi:hypothetical protein
VTDHDVEIRSVLGNPFFAPGQGDAGPQDCDFDVSALE